jgi:hypothetical protein
VHPTGFLFPEPQTSRSFLFCCSFKKKLKVCVPSVYAQTLRNIFCEVKHRVFLLLCFSARSLIVWETCIRRDLPWQLRCSGIKQKGRPVPNWGRRWCSWLRNCATRRKVAGFIPDGAIGIFRWQSFRALLWSWGRLSLEQKRVPGISPGGKDGRCVGLTTLPPSCADCLKILGASTCWSPRGLSGPVEGELYLYL